MPIDGAPVTRRQAIRIAGATGFVVLAGPRALTASPPARAAAACVLAPNLEIGPYFVDVKLNRSNLLTNADGSAKQAGVPLKLNLHVLNAKTCAAISGAQVDIWQANATGAYSDESNQSTLNQTWLRGYQLTDAGGLATFTTIFPGWYSGRTPHIHIMVRTFSGTKVAYEWTTQLLFEQSDIDTTLTKQAPYDERSRAQPDTSNASDHVYNAMVSDEAGGHSSMVLNLSGSAASGYSASMNVAVDLTSGRSDPTTPATVGASLRSCTVERTATGVRKATVKVTAAEAVSVLARVVRNGHLLGQSRLSARKTGARTVHLGIAKTAAAGKATLHLTFTNAAGRTKTVTRTIRIPGGSA